MKPPHLRIVSNKPRTYTSAEAVLDAVREAIYMDGRAYRILADKTGVSSSTIYNIASGRTTWPRHTTLFPLMRTLGMRIHIQMPEEKKE